VLYCKNYRKCSPRSTIIKINKATIQCGCWLVILCVNYFLLCKEVGS
jgi:hypothetical protein